MTDPGGIGFDQEWQGGLPADARKMPVPSSYNDIYPDPDVHDHVGDAWYETTVRVPTAWSGNRIVLHFGVPTHRATVWVNGVQVTQHDGGFTPFQADVTEVADPGGLMRITVAVNNVLTWASIPPGYVDDTPDGPRQRLLFDFFNYPGLHRPVWLCAIPKAHVRDITTVPGLTGTTGTVSYSVETEAAEHLDVRVTLADAGGREVAKASGTTGQLSVDDVNVWRPGDGYLYNLTSLTSRPYRGVMRVGGKKKGVFTRDRQPKAAARYLRERWRGMS